MRRSPEQIEPERLLEATEAVLDAVIEVAECLREFTAFEVQEATQFLVRLGVLPAETPSASSNDG
jgi:hypothetical protein